jgi:1-acyl-sn-glycerol-3-phosphate acyltransferase
MEAPFPIGSVDEERGRLLSPVELSAFRFAEFWASHLKTVSLLWNLTVISPAIWLSTCRRLSVQGAEHLHEIPLRDPVLLVANHRSFFDFYVVTMVCRFFGGSAFRRFFFPVRSGFFYDTVGGVAINLMASGMAMFPPIFRDPRKAVLNARSLEICVSELSTPRTVIGLHPEGTRSQSPDPFEVSPAKPGVGKIILEAAGVRVVPVFVFGLGNEPLQEIGRNWARSAPPLLVRIGREVDFADLRRQGSRPMTQKRAADRCVDAIRSLAGEVRAKVTGCARGVSTAGPERKAREDHEHQRA